MRLPNTTPFIHYQKGLYDIEKFDTQRNQAWMSPYIYETINHKSFRTLEEKLRSESLQYYIQTFHKYFAHISVLAYDDTKDKYELLKLVTLEIKRFNSRNIVSPNIGFESNIIYFLPEAILNFKI